MVCGLGGEQMSPERTVWVWTFYLDIFDPIGHHSKPFGPALNVESLFCQPDGQRQLMPRGRLGAEVRSPRPCWSQWGQGDRWQSGIARHLQMQREREVCGSVAVDLPLLDCLGVGREQSRMKLRYRQGSRTSLKCPDPQLFS